MALVRRQLVVQFERESDLGFKALQVKEKFGGLCFYTSFTDEPISSAIQEAEAESLRTCEEVWQARQAKSWRLDHDQLC